MRSLALLELLEAPDDGSARKLKQINIEQGNETLWFEASCASSQHGDGPADAQHCSCCMISPS